MSHPATIGLTGPNSSGKGVTAAHLTSAYGYQARSLSDVLREEARRRGLEPVRGVLIPLGNELRKLHGPGVLAHLVTVDLPPLALIDSIRHPEEVSVLRRLPGFVLMSVDASLAERFERSVRRRRPGDPGTLAEFVAREEQENTTDPVAQQLRATAALADHHIRNDGSIEELHARIDELMAQFARG